MEIAFLTTSLARIEGDDAGDTKLPVAVIKATRRKLALLRAAVDDRSLRNWKSLQCEKPRECEGERSIQLNDQYRLIFTLSELEPLTATIITIKEYQ